MVCSEVKCDVTVAGVLISICVLINYLAQQVSGRPELNGVVKHEVYSPVIPGGFSQEEGGKIPGFIQASLLKYCQKCSDKQKEKVEQVLLLLLNLNQNEDLEVQKKTIKKFSRSPFFKATSGPYQRGSMSSFPTPEIQYYPRGGGGSHQDLSNDNTTSTMLTGVIALPTVSTTPATFSFQSSTTVSSAPEPAQSVEMPTPPMPPTTSGPIYYYYMNSSSSSSSSLEPPTTSVVESSVASKSTTLQP